MQLCEPGISEEVIKTATSYEPFTTLAVFIIVLIKWSQHISAFVNISLNLNRFVDHITAIHLL